MSSVGADNDNANSNKILFTIRHTQLYVPIVTLSTNRSFVGQLKSLDNKYNVVNADRTQNMFV